MNRRKKAWFWVVLIFDFEIGFGSEIGKERREGGERMEERRWVGREGEWRENRGEERGEVEEGRRKPLTAKASGLHPFSIIETQ